ncbi:MAG: glycosyltransferase family protein [Nitrospinae bacterium]|nr:glycosyltransferase family protein [Nitrospinota bacterium]
MKIVAIVQARMGSERLPGKTLKRVSGKPMLEHIIQRVMSSNNIHTIVIATTNNKKDQPIINLSKRLSISYYAGSEDDVLNRFIGAVESVSTDAEINSAQVIVVRICGDNPLIDIRYLDEMINSHMLKCAEYTYNDSPIPVGTSGEVVNYMILKRVNGIARGGRYREHVTTYILDHLNEFRVNRTTPPAYLKDKTFRLTVDTEEDLKLIRRIYKNLYSKGDIVETARAITLLEENPSLLKINIHIPQRDWRL